MTLDEAIKRAKKIAEEQEKAAKEWHENQVRKCELIRFAEMDYTHENECKKCADEHRQLTEWLKDYKRLLEQQPCEDCVSREQVVKAMTDWYFDMLEKGEGKDFINILDALPPVTPTQSCIPVSERLPEEDGEYLLFGKIDEDEENYIFIGEYDSCGEQFGIWQEQFDRTTLGCIGSEFFEYSSVIAWQPLPKPYEEKRGNEND